MNTNRNFALWVGLTVLLLAALACRLPGGISVPAGGEEEPVEQPVEVVQQPTEAPPAAAQLVSQWAASASASSEYSNPAWSAQQATGAPDTPECGDQETAWASAESDGVDWLEVGYTTPVVPSEINIYESNSPGFIVRVEVRDETGTYSAVWEGAPGATAQCPRVLSIPVSGIDRRVVAVRIHLDQRNGAAWNEIDAVQLVGRP